MGVDGDGMVAVGEFSTQFYGGILGAEELTQALVQDEHQLGKTYGWGENTILINI